MTQLLTDVDLTRELGRKGKARILSHFSMDHHIGSLNALIHLAVDAKK